MCKSGCSVTVKLLSLFPSVILIGKEVQGFNESGNSSLFSTPSKQAAFLLPTTRFSSGQDLAWLLKTTIYPKVYIENTKMPSNTIKFNDLIKQHKQLFLDAIYD